MKPCPFCGEQIQETAQKCRYCGEWLTRLSPTSTPTPGPASSGPTQAGFRAMFERFFRGYNQDPRRWGWGRWSLVAVALLVGIGIANSNNASSTHSAAATTPAKAPLIVAKPTIHPSATPRPSATVRPSATPRPPTPTPAPVAHVLLDIHGSGIHTTQKFTTSVNDWDLGWAYDCSATGSTGNFIVNVYNGDGSPDASNAGVDELGNKGNGVEHFHSGGTKYLAITSECSWGVKVVG